MDDIAPKLIENVNKDFEKNLAEDKTAAELNEKLAAGQAKYEDAYNYAESVGNARARAFGDQISSDVLPEGKMHYNIASRLLDDSLTTDHDMVSEYAAGVQELYNETAEIGLKALKPDVDQDRIKGFIEGICNAEVFDDVAWKLAEPVITHARSVVDDTIKKNAEFQGRAGIKATVTRNADSKCCKWCSDLDGDYVYPAVPREVFQRHDNCRCTVDYKGRKLTAYNSGNAAHTFRDQGEHILLEDNAIKRNAKTEWKGKAQIHSKSEIAELRQYVAERGIVLDPSFNSFDGDISLVKDFADILNHNVNVGSHMRNDKVKISISYTLEDDTYAKTQGSNIILNGFAYRDRNILNDDYTKKVAEKWFTQGSTYLDIATHESAHVLVYLDQLKVNGVTEKVFGSDTMKATEQILDRISEYALVNERELISEGYVKYKNGFYDEYVLRILEYCGIL